MIIGVTVVLGSVLACNTTNLNLNTWHFNKRFCGCTRKDKPTTFLHRIPYCKHTSVKASCPKSTKTWHHIRFFRVLILIRLVQALSVNYNLPEALCLLLISMSSNASHICHLILVCQVPGEAVLWIASSERKTCPAYLLGPTSCCWVVLAARKFPCLCNLFICHGVRPAMLWHETCIQNVSPPQHSSIVSCRHIYIPYIDFNPTRKCNSATICSVSRQSTALSTLPRRLFCKCWRNSIKRFAF